MRHVYRSVPRFLFVVLCSFGLLIAANAQNTVQVTSTPITGVTITYNPADVNGATSGITNFTLTYLARVLRTTLTAPASSGTATFSNWVIDGIAQPVGQLTVTFPLSGNDTANAVYIPNWALTVQSTNPAAGVAIGVGPPDNGGLSNGVTTFVRNYADTTSVTLTAPGTATGNPFDRWVIGGVAQPVGQTAVTFPMTANTVAVAQYLPPVQVTVQSTSPSAGVPITAVPADTGGLTSGNTTFTLTYINGTSVTLTAPAASGINPFDHWTVAGVAQPVGQVAVTFTANAATTAIANYRATYTITASAVGTHGTVTPSGVVNVVGGANQLFTATPTAGWMVKAWTLDGTVAQNAGNTFTVAAVAANHTLTVSFQVVILFHPGDTNTDGRVQIAEVTAYSSAWKRGKPWPNAPSPIPQSFVTNLIMLWKTGELYTNDPSKPFPDTWVPISLAPQISKPATTATKASSSVATVLQQSDGTWLVNITVKPSSNTNAYTLEENIPAGVKVVSVSAGGVFDAKGRVIRWGPFLDAGTRILSYRIKAAGSVKLSGAASFDGALVNTTGTRTVGGKS